MTTCLVSQTVCAFANKRDSDFTSGIKSDLIEINEIQLFDRP